MCLLRKPACTYTQKLFVIFLFSTSSFLPTCNAWLEIHLANFCPFHFSRKSKQKLSFIVRKNRNNVCNPFKFDFLPKFIIISWKMSSKRKVFIGKLNFLFVFGLLFFAKKQKKCQFFFVFRKKRKMLPSIVGKVYYQTKKKKLSKPNELGPNSSILFTGFLVLIRYLVYVSFVILYQAICNHG